jgi:hypothetical protein
MQHTLLRRLWFYPTPGWSVLVSLTTTGLLFLSEQYHWFAFNEMKGWTVLIAVASTGIVLLAMLLWFAFALIFRWRFQFSIRSLLLLVFAAALPCSWLAVASREPKQERAAEAAIEKVGGHISWGQIWSLSQPRGPNGELQMAEPKWLRKLLGDDFFSGVFQADCENIPITDADLEYLEAMSYLYDLSLNNTDVTDLGLKHLKGLSNLIILRLNKTPITDSGLERLKGLHELRTLGLAGTQITDIGLEHLKGLSRLRWLDLRNTKVTDKGVKKLRQELPDIQYISQ